MKLISIPPPHTITSLYQELANAPGLPSGEIELLTESVSGGKVTGIDGIPFGEGVSR